MSDNGATMDETISLPALYYHKTVKISRLVKKADIA